MFDVVLIAGSVGAIGIVAAVSHYLNRVASRRSAASAAWRRAAEACGVADLRWSLGVLGQDNHLAGRWGAFTVRFEHSARRGRLRTAIVVGGTPGVVADISLRLEIAGPGGAGTEMEVGDPEFDDVVFIQGPWPILRAVLDTPTRRRVARLLRGGFTRRGEGDHRLYLDAVVAHGEVRAEVSGRDTRSLTALGEALETVLEVARRLAWPEDVPGRLAKHARHEALAAVRMANLLTLAREYPQEPLTLETLRAACEDKSEEVRLRAAIALGVEGREVLLALATREGGDEGVAVRAVEALGEYLPVDKGVTLLRGALRQRQRSLALACIESLGWAGASRSFQSPGNVLGLRYEVASSAGGHRELPEAEGALLAALRDEAPEIRCAAAHALGRVGTPAAVLPLRELAVFPIRGGGDLRQAARTAVAQIQARVKGATPGQVTLSEGEAGLVSLSDADSGRVSLSDATDAARDPGRR